MVSRWLAMICACHTKAMDMKLIDTTQKTRTITTLDSWTGRLRTRRSQVMVGALLVLGSPAIALLCEFESAAPGDVESDYLRAIGRPGLRRESDPLSHGK